jgi:hypothetical protein
MSVLLDATVQKPLDIGRAIYPQPVATACGYVLRARTFEQLLEATLKAAEVLSRYLGALALASYSCRITDPANVPFTPERFQKPLAFGDFVALTDSIAGANCDHPLRSCFNALDRRGKKSAAAERSTVANLIKLLNVRNDRGHDLSGMNVAAGPRSLRTTLREPHFGGCNPAVFHSCSIWRRYASGAAPQN